jgi:hypothetical protein
LRRLRPDFVFADEISGNDGTGDNLAGWPRRL